MCDRFTNLKNRLSSIYILDMADGTCVNPDGSTFDPLMIMAGIDEPDAEIVSDVRDAVQRISESGETGTYKLLQSMDLENALDAADLEVWGDLAGFESQFVDNSIVGFYREVTPEIAKDLGGDEPLHLVLINHRQQPATIE